MRIHQQWSLIKDVPIANMFTNRTSLHLSTRPDRTNDTCAGDSDFCQNVRQEFASCHQQACASTKFGWRKTTVLRSAGKPTHTDTHTASCLVEGSAGSQMSEHPTVASVHDNCGRAKEVCVHRFPASREDEKAGDGVYGQQCKDRTSICRSALPRSKNLSRGDEIDREQVTVDGQVGLGKRVEIAGHASTGCSAVVDAGC